MELWRKSVILTSNEKHFICEGKYRPVPRTFIKMSQANLKIILWWKLTQQKQFHHSSPGKGVQWLAERNLNQGEHFFAQTHPPGGSKKRYPLLFRKYEIHKGRHLYRTQKKADNMHQCTRRQKKYKKYSNKNSINQSPVQMPRLNGGGGIKGFFPQQKI